MGRSGVIQAGEFQRMTAGRGIRHSETNASRTDWAHVFRIVAAPLAGRARARAMSRSASARRSAGAGCASSPRPTLGRGSLLVHQDALIYSALLDPGQHVVHELSPGRSAWLHVVHGEVTLGDIVLTTGDGAGVTAERVVSLTAREDSSILLVDVGERNGVAG